MGVECVEVLWGGSPLPFAKPRVMGFVTDAFI